MKLVWLEAGRRTSDAFIAAAASNCVKQVGAGAMRFLDKRRLTVLLTALRSFFHTVFMCQVLGGLFHTEK